MPYSNVIDRGASAGTLLQGDAGALIPEDVSKEIIEGVKNKSAVLELFRHRTMTRAQQRMPVKSLLPTAYWVSGDTGLKQTTEVQWTSKYLDAAELAVIVPIPETLAADMDYSVWEEVKPDLEEAIAIALDNAVIFGINLPAEWTRFPGLVPAANAAGSKWQQGSGTFPTDAANDVNQLMAVVESDGFVPNAFWAPMPYKATLRGARATTGEFLFYPEGPANNGMANSTVGGQLMGERLVFSNANLSGWNNPGVSGLVTVKLITGDWNQGIIGIRQDITYKMLSEAVLQDGAGNIIYNLAQQDMIALRVTCRYAAQIPNPISRAQPVEASRYPFAFMYT